MNGHAYSYPLPTQWRLGLNLDLNDIERVVIHLRVPENYSFQSIINDYFFQVAIYPLPTLWRWGLNLDLNDIEKIVIHLSVPENYDFDTIISDFYSYHREQYEKITIRH